ncbi:hypothetical protein ACIBSW_12580 [Actinoplanes sp. NPDC049668]|uniref:hypothetical protein n=1 Tax=unclassified Actinoplanes TaxID=2626549 RepID=UPI0033A4187A
MAEFATPVDQRHAVLRAGGLHYATTHIGPLRQLLDDLAGIPDMAAAHVAVWGTVGADLHQISVLLRECLDQDLPRRDRLDVRSYLALMAHNVNALAGFAELAVAMAVVMRCANDVILLTRDIIRGIIGDLFARVILWIVDSPTASSRDVMEARLGIITATAWRIRAYVDAMMTSIFTLSWTVDG